MALLKRGVVDVTTCVYLCSLVDRVMEAYAEFGGGGGGKEGGGEAGRDRQWGGGPDRYCLEMKMLNAIAKSISTSRLAFVQHFLNLGVAESLESDQRY